MTYVDGGLSGLAVDLSEEAINVLEARSSAAVKAVHMKFENRHPRAPKVTTWLAKRQRFTLQFTPTSWSWANAVEGLFAKLNPQRLKLGVFKSVIELQATINRLIAETSDKPKPFVWTKPPTRSLALMEHTSCLLLHPIFGCASSRAKRHGRLRLISTKPTVISLRWYFMFPSCDPVTHLATRNSLSGITQVR
jgi:hypothetical protein